MLESVAPAVAVVRPSEEGRLREDMGKVRDRWRLAVMGRPKRRQQRMGLLDSDGMPVEQHSVADDVVAP